MNDLEHTLRAMRWRQPSPEFLQKTLETALAARPRPRRGFPGILLTGIARPMRWPLAACWLLSMFFRLTTPDPIPAATHEAMARMPPVDPALMLAQAELQRRLTDELVDELLRQRFDTSMMRRSINSPLP